MIGRSFVASAGLAVSLLSCPCIGAGMPGLGIVTSNPYGTLTVTGGVLLGDRIADLQPGAIIQLGNVQGNFNDALTIEFDGLSIGAGNSLTIRAGNYGQTVILSSVGPTDSVIEGTILAERNVSLPSVWLRLNNPNGITIGTSGVVRSSTDLTVSAFGESWFGSNSVTNHGTLDGGGTLAVRGNALSGGGMYMGDTIWLSTLTDARNPVSSVDFLANGLQLYPSTFGRTTINLILHAYGQRPQFINLMVYGSASVEMPHTFFDSSIPVNNAVVEPLATRPPGVPEPAYGGGSMILQATQGLSIFDPGYFGFPGAMVFKAGQSIDVHTYVNQAWTTSGQAFQGVFFEAPSIGLQSTVFNVLTNYPNWVNFSTVPKHWVGVASLAPTQTGGAAFVNTNATALHLNTYSTIARAAANGECWTCLINTEPFQSP